VIIIARWDVMPYNMEDRYQRCKGMSKVLVTEGGGGRSPKHKYVSNYTQPHPICNLYTRMRERQILRSDVEINLYYTVQF
jgi:hypothetical protein